MPSRTSPRVRRQGGDEPSGPRVLQGPHARAERGVRRRGDRPLLLPRQFLLRQRIHSGAADAGADVEEESVAQAAARAAAREVLHLRRNQHEDAEHGGDGGRRMAAIEARYKDAKIFKLDGVSVEYPDWHFNVRPSNTEPLLRLNLEGTTEHRWNRSATRCCRSSEARPSQHQSCLAVRECA